MKNYVQVGNTLTLIALVAVVSGMIYKVGDLIVVANQSVASGEEFEGDRVGVFTLPKTAANTPAQGAKAYLNAAGTEITTTATSNTLVGVFTEAYANGTTEAKILLTGQVV